MYTYTVDIGTTSVLDAGIGSVLTMSVLDVGIGSVLAVGSDAKQKKNIFLNKKTFFLNHCKKK